MIGFLTRLAFYVAADIVIAVGRLLEDRLTEWANTTHDGGAR